MKKIIVAFFALAITSLVSAQATLSPASLDILKKTGKVVEKITEKAETQTAAQSAVEEMMKVEELKGSAEAWYLKGLVFSKMIASEDAARQLANIKRETFTPKFVEAPLKALEAYAKASELVGTDKKTTKKLVTELAGIQQYFNEAGQVAYNKKDLKGAFDNFNGYIQSHDILKKLGSKSALDDKATMKQQLGLAGEFGYYADTKEVVPVLERMIAEGADTAYTYAGLYKYKYETDKAAALTLLEQGRKKFPEDGGLLFTEINHYIKSGESLKLIEKLKLGIQKEPKNANLYFFLGNTYDVLAQKGTDPKEAEANFGEAMNWYNKTLEVDPKNGDALYSLGAIYFNKGVAIAKEAAKLDLKQQKLYDEMEKKALAEYESALVYFKKSEAINPNDENTLIALKSIFAAKSDTPMTKEFNERLNTVRGGGKNAKSYFSF